MTLCSKLARNAAAFQNSEDRDEERGSVVYMVNQGASSTSISFHKKLGYEYVPSVQQALFVKANCFNNIEQSLENSIGPVHDI